MSLDHKLPIYLRIYSPGPENPTITKTVGGTDSVENSSVNDDFDNVLVFDTETTTDTKQELRVGYFRQYTNGSLALEGFFGPPENARYVADTYYSTEEFRRKLAAFAYKRNSLVVGFNLPFDISRIASGWSEARGNYEGGFRFAITDGTAVRLKHLAKHKALVGFSGKGVKAKFCDVSTLAKALFSRGFSLRSLADYLQVPTQKTTTDYDGAITTDYLDYLKTDVICTYQCFERLYAKWNSYGLARTRVNNVISEASIGKAVLKEMGVQSFLSRNDWPPELIGKIMGTYYGGRSEIHMRKTLTEVATLDFLSMYPTVCSLMNLWKFVIADEIKYEDWTDGAQYLLDTVNVDSLRDTSFWDNLHVICKVQPDHDIFPVRAKYNKVSQTVGVNYVSSDTPIWYTLADCVSSTLLTGKPPKILKAYKFYPSGVQSGLTSVDLLGNKQYRVDPENTDMYRRLIELRTTTSGDERLAIKIIANSTCYGIFIEIITDVVGEKTIEYYSDQKHCVTLSKEEKAGRYFNPLLATLITSAARLMLASLETLAKERNINWVLCDTDSMFLDFDNRWDLIEEICDFYQSINPYNVDVPLLKVENPPGESLICYAISAKRYCLFRHDRSIWKASSHGLGHLYRPYGHPHTKTTAPEWINDLWMNIVYDVPFKDGYMKQPAMAQYTASTPRLAQKVNPFNFISVFQLNLDYPKLHATPVSKFSTDPKKAANLVFDLDTLDPIPPCFLKNYAEVVATYQFHHESKFDDGDRDGWTQRKHVVVKGVRFIGKEGNKLEEQELGLANDDVVDYGMDAQRSIEVLQKAAETNTYQELADLLDISRPEVSRICRGLRTPSKKLVERIMSTDFPVGERVVEHMVSSSTKGVIEFDVGD